ncbi:hypothetical protein [Duncaniella dubosii]|uniref:hypothetical protein n=1 Tax=Duncaniella dubosii TaxID=2518971 RepID=UPI0023EF8082|nr:hypothetical protein [Duncaniella dubosii]MCX4284862.1 hypothetical protein [Duncaniella dubosii]
MASAWLAVATLQAADKLLVVGDATWGGRSLDRTSVMIPDRQRRIPLHGMARG